MYKLTTYLLALVIMILTVFLFKTCNESKEPSYLDNRYIENYNSQNITPIPISVGSVMVNAYVDSLAKYRNIPNADIKGYCDTLAERYVFFNYQDIISMFNKTGVQSSNKKDTFGLKVYFGHYGDDSRVKTYLNDSLCGTNNKCIEDYIHKNTVILQMTGKSGQNLKDNWNMGGICPPKCQGKSPYDNYYQQRH